MDVKIDGDDGCAGWCDNSRRWLFTFLLSGVPKACVFREQGNNECKREACSYYEWKPLTPAATKRVNTYRALSGFPPIET